MSPSRSRRRSGVSLRDHIARESGCDHPREPGEPTGYVAWFEWVEEYAKTHQCGQCSKCGLWVVWTPKTTGADRSGGVDSVAHKSAPRRANVRGHGHREDDSQ